MLTVSDTAAKPQSMPQAGVATTCLHCGLALPTGMREFCCNGCRAVYALLHEQELTRFYELRRGSGMPVPDSENVPRDRKWLEQIEAELPRQGELRRVVLDVQGVHCSGCVWLFQKLFERMPGGVRLLCNPSLGTLELVFREEFPLGRFVAEVERFGYAFGPRRKDTAGDSQQLLMRLGVSWALAGNSMMLSLAIYFGLRDGMFYHAALIANYVLAVLAVVVGGSVFVRTAVRALRMRVLHFDVPIALGIVLAFAGSTWSLFFGGGAAVYLDTLTVFIALMLTGRWLQERVLERNRQQLLAGEDAEDLLVRRVVDERVELVPCKQVTPGDILLLALGDLVPVDAVLLDDQTQCSLDWINGESDARTFQPGDPLPAGAFHLGTRAVRASAVTHFHQSPLRQLLQTPFQRNWDNRWWQQVASIYVVAVVAVAGLTTLGWLWFSGDVVKTLEVATAVLVVSCPCAFGIATPLAYELTHAALRKHGLFVRNLDFLDRALKVRQVVFDKTGTLTFGRPVLDTTDALDLLTTEQREILYNLAARSSHPKSLAIMNALELERLQFRPQLAVQEYPGQGLELHHQGIGYRLGSGAWVTRARPRAAMCGEDNDLVFTADDRVLAQLNVRESPRPDAALELARLRQSGYRLWVLSGDSQTRTTELALRLNIDKKRAIGDLRPEDKAAWIDANDGGHTLMIGDGVNDSLAVQRALCSGTPAIDRPFMPARTDFYLTTAGLNPVAIALTAARKLARVVRRNLAVAVGYNIVALAVAIAGFMTPWLAAILMPASSLVLIASTLMTLAVRGDVWTS